MNIKEILEITGGKLLCGDDQVEVRDFERDSRKVVKGGTYVAIVGEKFDGNDFYEDAINNEASVCILSKKPNKLKGNIILVEDTIKAIQDIATYKRSQYDIPVVAVTGSVGKTSTKDIIASVMSRKYKVLKTEGNLNNFIGLPFTILRLKDEEAMVIEMGMNHFGEISVLTQIAKPTLAVITNIGTAHIGNLGSRENILKAKLEILEGLQPNCKIDNVETSNSYNKNLNMNKKSIVINADNDLLEAWARENREDYNIITYGINNKDSKYVAKDIKAFPDKSIYNLHGYEVTVPIGGEHFVLNSLCATAVGRYFDIPMEEILKGIAEFELTKKRMEISYTKNGAIIVNDSYNANYDSMKAAIQYLKSLQNKRKIAVLGDMLELGEYSEEIHRKIGDEIKDIDILVTVGKEAKYIAQNAKISNIIQCENNEEAISKIKDIISENDAILIKASNSMNFNEIAEKLKEM